LRTVAAAGELPRMTIHVLARAAARPEHRDALLQALRDHAALSRREAGCLGYEVAQALDDANVLATVERWRDEEALAAHLRSAHVARLLAAVPDLVAAPPEIRSYRTLAD
jgi:quinol monooxygenase YgiN